MIFFDFSRALCSHINWRARLSSSASLHISFTTFFMPPHTRLRSDVPNTSTEPTDGATTPDERPESPVDAHNCDDGDLEHLPHEKRIQLAVAASQSGRMSQRKAAQYYRVPRTSVQDRANGVLIRSDAHLHERKLTKAQEDVLAEWIKCLGRRGVPLSLPTIGAYAAEIYGGPLGVTWATRFKKRRSDLKVKWTSSLEECRARALNRPVVHDYFVLLADTVQQYEIKPKNVWNMDEKGIQLGVGDRIRALVDRDQKVVQKIESGNRDLVTIIEAISGDGTALHPSVVFQGQRRDLRLLRKTYPLPSISISPNGWTDQELGALWLEKDFAPASAERLDDPGDYRLLILDGHNSHCTYNFISFAQKHRIIVLCLPSHTTHALQPCDVGVFSPLAAKWKARVGLLHAQGISIDKYNLLSNYAVARDQAFKKSTIIAAFRKCGICPLNENAIPDALFAPAENYTTQAAMPLAPRLPSLLAPVATGTTLGSSSGSSAMSTCSRVTRSTSATQPTTSSNQSILSRTSMHSSIATGNSSATQRRPSTPTNSATNASSSQAAPATQSHPSTPPNPVTTSCEALQARDAFRAAYAVAMPSPVRKTASRSALAAENEQLRSLLKVAGYDLDQNYAQMVLMEHENKNLRQQLFAKKNKAKRAYTTGKARLMTSSEMQEELLKTFQRSQMAEMHVGLKKLFPAIKKRISEAMKAETAAAKKREREAKAAEKAAEKAAKAAEKEAAKAAKAAAKARGQGRGRGRGWVQDDGNDEGSGPESNSSGADSDSDDHSVSTNPGPSATEVGSSDEETDSDKLLKPTSHNINSPLAPQDASDDDDESDQEETGIISFNGHRWESRRNLQFQVVWTDGDVTWEPLSNVNDCAAMEGYLAHRDVDDPLRLSKRKFLINKALKASNE
ncbi:DDE-domain-containing protein [Mycena venus]|uniref:DDE-domain-containing protein n=1 Tax=Mycena venus TaxID=2733690 RepID=A0A8H6X5Z4_9AGAR|nr:DDE-domain-containing protein [Mycena venus]